MTPETVTVDGVKYVRAYPVVPGRCAHCGAGELQWTAPRIIAAFQRWAEAHGGVAPSNWSWVNAAPEHPSFRTVHNTFGTWTAGVLAAGLTPRQPHWTREAIIDALVAWGRTHDGTAPREVDWRKAAPDHPTSFTVKRRFGTWNAAIDEAGFFPRGPWGVRLRAVQGEHMSLNATVDAAPVAEAVRDYLGAEGAANDLAALMDMDASPIHRLLAGKRPRIAHIAADRILTAIDRPDVLAALEPAA